MFGSLSGLGIGTSPAAFINHGIPTTVVEIDPVVHKYALEYFNLPTNHTSVIRNAVDYVRDARAKSAGRYRYIIHDVFTGGVEPLDLFTAEFLEGLRALLNHEGTIAIVSPTYGAD